MEQFKEELLKLLWPVYDNKSIVTKGSKQYLFQIRNLLCNIADVGIFSIFLLSSLRIISAR